MRFAVARRLQMVTYMPRTPGADDGFRDDGLPVLAPSPPSALGRLARQGWSAAQVIASATLVMTVRLLRLLKRVVEGLFWFLDDADPPASAERRSEAAGEGASKGRAGGQGALSETTGHGRAHEASVRGISYADTHIRHKAARRAPADFARTAVVPRPGTRESEKPTAVIPLPPGHQIPVRTSVSARPVSSEAPARAATERPRAYNDSEPDTQVAPPEVLFVSRYKSRRG